DNDWRTIQGADEAHVEVSTDGGSSWTGVWDQIGTDIRSTHEVIDVTGFLGGQSNVSVRVRVVQPGWDWWWVLDNFSVYGRYLVPVELTSFTASANNGNVNLNWVTATETNNQGFEVERKAVDGEFDKVGYVAGFGTTTETKSYSFVDTDVEAGSYTYRLKQVDLIGTYEYSPEIEVDVTTPIEYALEQNYPNPFNPSTAIKYSIPQDGIVTLAVFNLLGEKVATLVNGVQQAGRYEVNFDASKFASGIYVYTINAGSFNSVKKMILMK
ncbi:MAG: T9SS type A sorting domain-containing protein, partial [Ignavibacteria bacterium]|nr:T9SS type A sorting domain-containing protein [Ignavibacteria bacterium]